MAGYRALPSDVRLFSLVSIGVAITLVLLVGYKDEFRAASAAFPAILVTLVASRGTAAFSRSV